jgi:hypothetical protein
VRRNGASDRCAGAEAEAMNAPGYGRNAATVPQEGLRMWSARLPALL